MGTIMKEDLGFQIHKYETSDKIIWNEFLLKCKIIILCLIVILWNIMLIDLRISH